MTALALLEPEGEAVCPRGSPSTRCRLITSLDAAWNSVLAWAQHDFYHLTSYAELSAHHESGSARAVLVEDDERTFLLPLILRPIPGGGQDATSPYGYPGPVGKGLEDPAFVAAAFRQAERILAAEGVVSLFVRFHPVFNPVVPEGIGHLASHGDAVTIDLSQPAEALWKQMRKNHRRQIAHSIRCGHAVGLDETDRAFAAFKDLYRETMRRLDAPAYYAFDDAYFEALRSAMGARMRLAAVRIGNEMAAAGLFIEEDGVVQFHLSATDPRFAMFSPTKRLTHFMTGWAMARGNRWLHLGAGNRQPDDALLHFKSGFSPLRHSFRTLRLVLDAGAYRRLSLERDPSADPSRLDGFFPAYRKP